MKKMIVIILILLLQVLNNSYATEKIWISESFDSLLVSSDSPNFALINTNHTFVPLIITEEYNGKLNVCSSNFNDGAWDTLKKYSDNMYMDNKMKISYLSGSNEITVEIMNINEKHKYFLIGYVENDSLTIQDKISLYCSKILLGTYKNSENRVIELQKDKLIIDGVVYSYIINLSLFEYYIYENSGVIEIKNDKYKNEAIFLFEKSGDTLNIFDDTFIRIK